MAIDKFYIDSSGQAKTKRLVWYRRWIVNLLERVVRKLQQWIRTLSYG
jgi:hypothetical protein